VEIDHGYAQTGHSAQGLGAQTVILDLPSNSQTLNRRSFYTNLTRTKNQVKAFTDDREKLTGAVTREKNKTISHDVEKAIREEWRKPPEKMREKKTMERPDDLRFGETPEQTKARFKMKEERKEEKEDKAVTDDRKVRELGKDQDKFRARTEERPEQKQEKEREKKKEGHRVEVREEESGTGWDINQGRQGEPK
ncbi:TrwC protein, partial [mine drainage metagenome]